MTRDEHRAQCIEVSAKAHYDAKRHINVKYPVPSWDELGPISKAYKLKLMTAAFDSLRSAAARVVPVEATEGMIEAGRAANLEQYPNTGLYERIWRAMVATGNLTKPPETKP